MDFVFRISTFTDKTTMHILIWWTTMLIPYLISWSELLSFIVISYKYSAGLDGILGP